MKKIIKGILVLLLCVGVVGCGGKKDKHDWDFYEKVTKKAKEKGYNFSYIIDDDGDDKKYPDYMVLYDGTDSQDTTTWEKGIKVQFMPDVTEPRVVTCRFYDADYKIPADDLESSSYRKNFINPLPETIDENDMILVYSPLQDPDNKNSFCTDAPNFLYFLDFISGIGLTTVEKLNSYCDMFFIKANQKEKTDSKPKIEYTSDINCINVTVGDTFGGDIDFDPIDDIENYDLKIKCDKEFIEFNPDENSLKALKAGETEIQFYAISKITKEEIKSNTVKVIIKEPTTDD